MFVCSYGKILFSLIYLMQLFLDTYAFIFISILAKKKHIYTNSNFIVPISLKQDGVNILSLKLGLFDRTELIV